MGHPRPSLLLNGELIRHPSVNDDDDNDVDTPMHSTVLYEGTAGTNRNPVVYNLMKKAQATEHICPLNRQHECH